MSNVQPKTFQAAMAALAPKPAPGSEPQRKRPSLEEALKQYGLEPDRR